MGKSIFTREHRVFTELLRETREEAGITQIELAERLGQTQSYISKVERGDRRLDVVQLLHFCRALGTTLPALMTAFEERLAQKRPKR
jgi:transcriptional regulator with XRE-family HTH domain